MLEGWGEMGIVLDIMGQQGSPMGENWSGCIMRGWWWYEWLGYIADITTLNWRCLR